MKLSKQKWYNRESALKWAKKRKKEKRKISTKGPDGIIWVNIQRREWLQRKGRRGMKIKFEGLCQDEEAKIERSTAGDPVVRP